jgi:CheY-like chemotaxis protein
MPIECGYDDRPMAGKGLILIVEDDAGTQLLIETLLKTDGYEVEAAGSVTVARQRLMDVTPDLILMDIELPDGDGLTLTAWIKRNGRTKSIPVVALTSYTRLEKRVAASEVGCAGFISKPIETSRFVKQVEGYLIAR